MSSVDRNVCAAIGQFHERLRARDADMVRVAQVKVIDATSNMFKRSQYAPKLTRRFNATDFLTTALSVAGTIQSCAVEVVSAANHSKELAAYFGVHVAKNILSLSRVPPGFNVNKMEVTLRRFYKSKYSCARKSHSSTLPVPAMFVSPALDHGLGLSDEMKAHLKRGTMPWSPQWTGRWINVSRPFDSRTEEWSTFLSFLLASPYQNEAMIVWMQYILPPNPAIALPLTFFTDPINVENTTSMIAKSVFCSEVFQCNRSQLIAKCEPVRLALPFIVDLLVRPAADVHESTIPSGFYVTTLSIRFKDWNIEVAIFRP